MKWKDLQLVVFSAKMQTQDLRPLYLEGFRHWHAVWHERFIEAGSVSKLYGDNFSRQDDIFAIFHQDKCIAMICSRFCDLSLPNIKMDSYFASWPEIAFQKLRVDGDDGAIGSQISVESEYRGPIEGISLKNMITILSMNYLFNSGISAVTGTMRADKNMHSMCYKLGAEKLAQDILMHGGPVELIGFFPKRYQLRLSPEEKDLMDSLWSKKIGQTFKEITLPSQRRTA